MKDYKFISYPNISFEKEETEVNATEITFYKRKKNLNKVNILVNVSQINVIVDYDIKSFNYNFYIEGNYNLKEEIYKFSCKLETIFYDVLSSEKKLENDVKDSLELIFHKLFKASIKEIYNNFNIKEKKQL